MGSSPHVRIGYAFGTRTRLNDDGFATVVDSLERLGFDSLWLSERIGGDAPDPLVGMAFAAGRTTKLKFGMSVMVLPGRNPIVLAKELATLDRLSNGRLLPAFGLGVADPHEQQAFGVERGCPRQAVRRGAGSAPRCVGGGEPHASRRPLPLRRSARAAEAPSGAPRRVARRHRAQSNCAAWGGWLMAGCPASSHPTTPREGGEIIEATLAEHGRTIDEDHYGALISYSSGPVPQSFIDLMAKRRPDLADPTVLVPQGWDALMATIDKFVAIGTTKFVILPIVEPATPEAWVEHLESAAPIVLARQT